MADSDHIELMKKGPEKWNEWRSEAPFVPDFRDANLINADFRGMDLSDADFSGAWLLGACFERADLRRAKLDKVRLDKALFVEAKLKGASLFESGGHETSFFEADLREAIFDEVDFRECEFDSADLSGANLSDINLSGSTFRGANFKSSRLKGIDLSDAKLSDTDFRDADIRIANLDGADLRRARLIHANLHRASLVRANLQEAFLGESTLTRADLEGANCINTVFYGTNLQEARLSNADLRGATLDGVQLWETQRAGWMINGVNCNCVFWDEGGEELESYGPGDFERLFTGGVKIRIQFPGGLESLELISLPALIRHLQRSHPGAKLRLDSINESSTGVVASVIVESEDTNQDQIARLKADIESEANQKVELIRQAFQQEQLISAQLRGRVETYQETVKDYKEFVARYFDSSRSQFLLQGGNLIMGDEYKVGQAGTVGPKGYASNNTFNQNGSYIESSIDLKQLAEELSTLRVAMKQSSTELQHDEAVGEIAKAEKAAREGDSSKVSESLKAGGKFALEVATKTGASLVSEVIKHAMGMN